MLPRGDPSTDRPAQLGARLTTGRCCGSRGDHPDADQRQPAVAWPPRGASPLRRPWLTSAALASSTATAPRSPQLSRPLWQWHGCSSLGLLTFSQHPHVAHWRYRGVLTRLTFVGRMARTDSGRRGCAATPGLTRDRSVALPAAAARSAERVPLCPPPAVVDPAMGGLARGPGQSEGSAASPRGHSSSSGPAADAAEPEQQHEDSVSPSHDALVPGRTSRMEPVRSSPGGRDRNRPSASPPALRPATVSACQPVSVTSTRSRAKPRAIPTTRACRCVIRLPAMLGVV